MRIEPCNAPVGANVYDIDLSQPVDDRTFGEITDAFARYSVLIFKDQDLTEDEHIAFSKRFGELEVLKFYQKYLHPGHQEIFVVSNIVENDAPIGLQEAGRVWHTDVSYKQAPSMGSLLYAREVPHDDAGEPLGDTLFASAAAAYDALPAEMRARIDPLFAIHKLDEKRYHRDQNTNRTRGTRAELTSEQKDLIKEIVHPVVRTHPVSGRKCIYVNELYTFTVKDMPEAEGADLISQLCEHITQGRFVYRHKWSVGDLLLWDNCATQHLAIGDYTDAQRRLMHRTTVQGGVPF